MKLQITSEKENALYDRREIVAKVTDTEATPSRKAILEELCKAAKCAAENVVIDEVTQPFGVNACVVHAKVYAKPEALAKYEKAYKGVRTAGKAAAKAEDAAKK